MDLDLKGGRGMRNLAGDRECDKYIKQELIRCGVTIIKGQSRDRDVLSTICGKLGRFTFYRAWRYWIVDGPVYLSIAEELYAHPVGKTDIRVNGHCGCPAPGGPGGEIVWRDRITGKILLTRRDYDHCLAFIPDNLVALEAFATSYLLCDNPADVGNGFIESYHIDSELGLYVFVETLKKHGLA